MARDRNKRAEAKIGYPPRPVRFLAMNFLVKMIPTGWKFWANSILFKTSVANAPAVGLSQPYEWTWAGPDEIEFMDRHPEASSSSAYARRAARGDKCLCVKIGSEVVAYRWVGFRSVCILCGFGPGMEIEVFRLKPEQAFCFDLYTYQKHRRFGIADILNRIMYRQLRENGIKEVFSFVSPVNIPAVRTQLKLGAEPHRMAYSYRIRGWSRTFLGPEADPGLRAWMARFQAGSVVD